MNKLSSLQLAMGWSSTCSVRSMSTPPMLIHCINFLRKGNQGILEGMCVCTYVSVFVVISVFSFNVLLSECYYLCLLSVVL